MKIKKFISILGCYVLIGIIVIFVVRLIGDKFPTINMILIVTYVLVGMIGKDFIKESLFSKSVENGNS